MWVTTTTLLLLFAHAVRLSAEKKKKNLPLFTARAAVLWGMTLDFLLIKVQQLSKMTGHVFCWRRLFMKISCDDLFFFFNDLVVLVVFLNIS